MCDPARTGAEDLEAPNPCGWESERPSVRRIWGRGTAAHEAGAGRAGGQQQEEEVAG